MKYQGARAELDDLQVVVGNQLVDFRTADTQNLGPLAGRVCEPRESEI
jgi:hypothetical protein